MTKEPLKLIDEYLERVRIYLAIDAEDTLTEIKVHLIEDAEKLGSGTLSIGSAMLAIERFGDPKDVASEYAGTKKKAGIPVEYTQPLLRILIVLVAASIAVIAGAYVVGFTFPNITFSFRPFDLILMIVGNVLIVLVIIGSLAAEEEEKTPTEKTALESFLSIGTDSFKPKDRKDAVGDIIGGILFGIFLLLPQMALAFSPAFVPIASIVAAFSFVNALKGVLYTVYGENNVYLLIETIFSTAWILLAMVLLNIGWPFHYAWVYTSPGNGWILFPIMDFNILNIFDVVWTFILFITVAVSTWRVIVSIMKISMYLDAGRGIFWKGSWGETKPTEHSPSVTSHPLLANKQRWDGYSDDFDVRFKQDGWEPTSQ
jgi:hypothetical protein